MASIHTHKMIGCAAGVYHHKQHNQDIAVHERPGAVLIRQTGQSYNHVNRSFAKVHLVLLGS